MAVASSSRTTGLVSRKALLHLLLARIYLVQQRQKMQDCVPLDVLCTYQAHRFLALLLAGTPLLSAAGTCPLAHQLSLHQLIQHRPYALLQACFLGVSTQWSS